MVNTWYFKIKVILCAQRVEISVKGAKMDKNMLRVRIFGPIAMKIGTHDL